MTLDEVLDLLTAVRSWWPHSDVDSGDPRVAATMWHEALAGVEPGEALDALRRLRDSGRQHAPVVGEVLSTVSAARQGEPPSFDDLQAQLSRLLPRCSPYSPTGSYSAADTAETVRRLGEAGAHETVLRFVASQGLRAVKAMPDGSLHPLDMGQQADRRDKAREYRDRTLLEWRLDPRPGLALERAERAALGSGRTGLRQLSIGSVAS